MDNGLVGSKEDLLEDLKHMRAVIRHMIDREGTLSIVHEPERAEGEDETQYRQRCLSERVLGLGLNYSFE